MGADSLRYALGAASRTLLASYLQQLHALGKELSVSTDYALASDAVLALARSSGDDYPGRSDEPYRRALLAVQSRVAATYAALTGQAPPRTESGARRRGLCLTQELRADLAALARSLVEHGGELLATGGALGRLTAQWGSGSTWPRWTCGRTPTCTRGWWWSCCALPASRRTMPR